MNRGALKNEIFTNQQNLWEIETKLNLPLSERALLGKGWANLNDTELTLLAAKISEQLKSRSEELAQMEAEYGKADDVRKEIEALVEEYREACKEVDVIPTFFFPKGYRYKNPSQLQSYLKAAREWTSFAKQRVLERAGNLLLRKQAAAEREKQAEIERQQASVELEAINALRETRLRMIFEITAPLRAVREVLKNNKDLNSNAPNVELSLRSSLMLGLMKEEDFVALAAAHQKDVAAVMRKLREQLRRAHQSAQARNLTKLGFEEYLKQNGLQSILK